METETICTIRALAAALRLPALWLKAEADAGRIPCLRVGRRLLFNLDAVKATLAERAARTGGAR